MTPVPHAKRQNTRIALLISSNRNHHKHYVLLQSINNGVNRNHVLSKMLSMMKEWSLGKTLICKYAESQRYKPYL
jgi:hypothetical protein